MLKTLACKAKLPGYSLLDSLVSVPDPHARERGSGDFRTMTFFWLYAESPAPYENHVCTEEEIQALRHLDCKKYFCIKETATSISRTLANLLKFQY